MLAATAICLVPAASTQATKPVAVKCGQTVTADTTLANDLADCPGVGIVIGADGITLDLNGHTVDGDGVADVEGINNDGHDHVTVMDGAITDFVEGVVVLDARDNRLRGLSTRRNRHAGIFVDGATDTDIEGNSTADRCAGVIVTRSRDISVERNTTTGGECSGIPIFESDDVAVIENSVARAGSGGILLLRDSDGNRVERNSVSGGAGDGIVIAEEGDHNLVSQNSVSRNGGLGVILDVGTSDNGVTDNTLRANAFGGMAIVGSDDNLVAQNSIGANGRSTDGPEGGIHLVSLPGDPETISRRNAIVDNALSGNNPDGILVDPGHLGTLIEGNVAERNMDDGIDVDSASTTLTRNVANRNRDLGIEAVFGVGDGGGNSAQGNGDPLQCTNVFCGA